MKPVLYESAKYRTVRREKREKHEMRGVTTERGARVDRFGQTWRASPLKGTMVLCEAMQSGSIGDRG